MIVTSALLLGPALPRPAVAEDALSNSAGEHEVAEPEVTDADRDHWAFRPLVRPRVPEVKDATWVRSPIDAFILSRIESQGRQPAVEADRQTLIRRLCFDLVGLPPTPEQVDRFVADSEPRAYERLVDQLLGSRHYGERWAQLWLDLARFAETDGYEHDKVRPEAWKYRDWVIAVLNDDMSYDRFVQWQIAGDVLAPDTADAVVATAFCLSGPDMPDINSQEERRHTLLNELTSTVGSVFLSLQVGCAQCHDHKYDPISHADFYRLRAFFDPAVVVTKNKSVNVMTAQGKACESHIMLRGDWKSQGPRVNAAFPRIANPMGLSVQSTDPGQQRVELAHWLTRTDHPLTARVLVNRIWQAHFGTGLSATPSDFGIMGEAPTHPDLLDWLAREFMASDWKIKNLHRLILNSSVYRQSSQPPADVRLLPSWSKSLTHDASNRLLSRFPRQRLEAEIVRDALLAVSGTLSRRAGGPGVMPPLPKELTETLLKNQWKTSQDPDDHRRRSIYVFARRNLRYPLFDAFDRPDANASCARRGESTTAPQALLMLNSQLSMTTAESLASLVVTSAPDDDAAQVREVYRRALQRLPTDEEMQEALVFLHSSEDASTDSAEADDDSTPVAPGTALRELCRAILNCSEFIYVD